MAGHFARGQKPRSFQKGFGIDARMGCAPNEQAAPQVNAGIRQHFIEKIQLNKLGGHVAAGRSAKAVNKHVWDIGTHRLRPKCTRII